MYSRTKAFKATARFLRRFIRPGRSNMRQTRELIQQHRFLAQDKQIALVDYVDRGSNTFSQLFSSAVGAGLGLGLVNFKPVTRLSTHQQLIDLVQAALPSMNPDEVVQAMAVMAGGALGLAATFIMDAFEVAERHHMFNLVKLIVYASDDLYEPAFEYVMQVITQPGNKGFQQEFEQFMDEFDFHDDYLQRVDQIKRDYKSRQNTGE